MASNEETDLNAKKYRELQKIAKEAGIKANLPRVQLIQKLLEAKSSKAEENLDIASSDEDDDTPEGKEMDRQLHRLAQEISNNKKARTRSQSRALDVNGNEIPPPLSDDESSEDETDENMPEKMPEKMPGRRRGKRKVSLPPPLSDESSEDETDADENMPEKMPEKMPVKMVHDEALKLKYLDWSGDGTVRERKSMRTMVNEMKQDMFKATVPQVKELFTTASKKCLKREIKLPLPSAKRSRKFRPKVETRSMRKWRREGFFDSDSDSLHELSDSVEDYAEDVLESEFVSDSGEEDPPTLPAGGPPYPSPSEMPETNAREKWWKQLVLEIFVPTVRDGAVEENETLGSGPTWFSDTEDEQPPPKKEKPRPITKTEMKRAQIKAQVLVGTPPKVIVETLGVGINLVYKVIKMMKQNPDGGDRAMAIEPRNGRPRKRTPELIKILKETYEADPLVHYSFTAKQLGVSKQTVSRGLADIGMKSFIRRYRALISTGSKVKRVERAEEMLEWMSDNPSTNIIFSDKIIITADGHMNRQLDRYVARSRQDVKPVWRSKKAVSAMALGAIGSDGSQMPLYWFPKRDDGRGVDQDQYIEAMESVVLPWIQDTYESKNVLYIWQQAREIITLYSNIIE